MTKVKKYNAKQRQRDLNDEMSSGRDDLETKIAIDQLQRTISDAC